MRRAWEIDAGWDENIAVADCSLTAVSSVEPIFLTPNTTQPITHLNHHGTATSALRRNQLNANSAQLSTWKRSTLPAILVNQALRIQVCPKKGITPYYPYIPILSMGLEPKKF